MRSSVTLASLGHADDKLILGEEGLASQHRDEKVVLVHCIGSVIALGYRTALTSGG